MMRSTCHPADSQRTLACDTVGHLIDIATQQHNGRKAVLDWLRLEYALEKRSQKIQDMSTLDPDTLVAEVNKGRGKTKPLSVAGLKALKDEHFRSIVPLQTLAAEARRLETQLADLVNAAYDLTPEEVSLLWRTAPPRMPGEAPPI